ncbi:MAG: 30S ribosomal protein S16, partial [Planctomycetes bacterium]|nr:30S ribosomal protein S16 [Planctomycetota bacterium]
IEEVGSFDPMVTDESRQTTLKADRIQYWISVGAQPSDTVRRMLVKHGVIEGGK